jgi:hypothetical protein
VDPGIVKPTQEVQECFHPGNPSPDLGGHSGTLAQARVRASHIADLL